MGMAEQEGDSLIRYTVKEMLAQMFLRLDKLDEKLDTFGESKADRADVLALALRINSVEKWITQADARRDSYLELQTQHKGMLEDVEALKTQSVSRAFVLKVAATVLGTLASAATIVAVFMHAAHH